MVVASSRCTCGLSPTPLIVPTGAFRSFTACKAPIEAGIGPARAAVGLSAWELDCRAALTIASHVKQRLRLSVGIRQVPLLTLPSGTQRARQRLPGDMPQLAVTF